MLVLLDFEFFFGALNALLDKVGGSSRKFDLTDFHHPSTFDPKCFFVFGGSTGTASRDLVVEEDAFRGRSKKVARRWVDCLAISPAAC
jgi:hypothetical protein